MTFTYDPTTEIGRCRLLVRDIEQAAALFSDEDYEAFLALEGDVRLAAAQALETLASDQAYRLKVLKSGGDEVDGTKTAQGILARAALLRQQAERGDAGALFDVAEMVIGPFSYRERVDNEALRAGL